jgi:hypothetical protein
MSIRDFAPAGQAYVAGKFDAYSRLLAWENFVARRRNRSRMQRYLECRRYYHGDNMPSGDMQLPLAINYVRVIADLHTSFLWGQWEPQTTILTWAVKPRAGRVGDKEQIKTIQQWLNELFMGHEELLYVGGSNQSIYGDAILVPRWDDLEERVYPESVLPESFHARWSAHDINRLNEVVISYHIAREDAMAEYGTPGSTRPEDHPLGISSFQRDFALYWEWWTDAEVQIYVDSQLVRHDPNPFSTAHLPGLIPFIHIPGVRAGGEFYGTSDIEPVLELQDELNRKMADSSDIVGYSAHPIVLVRKYFGKVGDLPVGPDAVWDMGRDGEAEYLSGTKPPVDINVYIERLMQTIQDLTFLPKTAYGHTDETERSAISLAMKMLPTTNRVTWKRLLWASRLRTYAHMAARLEEIHGDLPFNRAYLIKVTLEPQFAPILPKDRAAQVVENVSLVTNGMRSTPRALEDLGEAHIDDEVEAIFKDLTRKAALMKLNLGGANARGPGGSPDTGAEQRAGTS